MATSSEIYLRALGAPAAIAAACALLGWFLLHERESSGALAIVAIGASITAAVTYATGAPRLLPKRGPEALVLAITGVVIAAATAWNVRYFRYIRTLIDPHEVFRIAMQRPHTPVYGRPADPTIAMIAVTAVGAAMLAAGAVVFVLAPQTRRRRRGAVALIAAQLIGIGCFALSERPPRIAYDVAGLGMPAAELAHFQSIRELLSTYVERMPSLGWTNRHYPPGNLVVSWMQRWMGIRAAFKAIVVAAVLAAAVPLYALSRALSLDDRAARLAVALKACSASAAVYPTVSNTPLVMLFALISVWGVLLGIKSGRRAPVVVAGAATVIHWMFSFSFAVVVVLIAAIVLFSLLSGRIQIQRAVATALIFGLTVAAGLLVIRLTGRLDLIACLMQAVRQHAIQMNEPSPFAPWRSYVLRSAGNLLAA